MKVVGKLFVKGEEVPVKASASLKSVADNFKKLEIVDVGEGIIFWRGENAIGSFVFDRDRNRKVKNIPLSTVELRRCSKNSLELLVQRDIDEDTKILLFSAILYENVDAN